MNAHSTNEFQKPEPDRTGSTRSSTTHPIRISIALALLALAGALTTAAAKIAKRNKGGT